MKIESSGSDRLASLSNIVAGNLAIVIPAYKTTFFENTIRSIANQTCKNFTVYIGQDGNEHDFGPALLPYKDLIKIVYHTFPTNLGKIDLVSHWNRCVDLVKGEPWIWMFSDDDEMSETCVEKFYESVDLSSSKQLFHFDITVVDSAGKQKYRTKKFPKVLSSNEFFSSKLKGSINSCGVEFIFKRSTFDDLGKFEPFDLGWSADNATWMKLAIPNGIHTIPGPLVKWRLSDQNISSLSGDRNIVIRKLEANVAFLEWAKSFLEKNKLPDLSTSFEKASWLSANIADCDVLTMKQRIQLINSSLTKVGLKNVLVPTVILCIIRRARKALQY